MTKQLCRRCERWMDDHRVDDGGASRCEDGGKFLPARKTRSASNSFNEGELKILYFLAQQVVKGQYPSIGRDKSFPSLLRKVKTMRETTDREKKLWERAEGGSS